MKYKVGDRVKIKSLDWYNENKDEDGEIVCGEFAFLKDMKKFCSETLTISADVDDGYLIFEDDHGYVWTDEMFERLVERNGKTYPYKIGDRVVLKGNNKCATITDLKYNSWRNLSYYIKIDNDKDISIDSPTDLLLPYDNKVEGLVEEETKPKNEYETNGEFYSTIKYLVRPSGYQFVDENGNVINAQKIVLKKKKKEYPKTYEECCKVLSLGEDGRLYTKGYKASLIQNFQKLLICRDAYWKIAGKEMGLGKPWAPDWNNVSDKYCIYLVSGYAWSKECQTRQCTFAFPTPEMRDAFKENFDPDIEFCKEFL